MTIFLMAISFAGGFAVCWFFRPKVAAAVVDVNKAVVTAKSVASTVVTDIKKV